MLNNLLLNDNTNLLLNSNSSVLLLNSANTTIHQIVKALGFDKILSALGLTPRVVNSLKYSSTSSAIALSKSTIALESNKTVDALE